MGACDSAINNLVGNGRADEPAKFSIKHLDTPFYLTDRVTHEA